MKKSHTLFFTLIGFGLFYALVQVVRISGEKPQSDQLEKPPAPIERIISLPKSPVPFIILGLDASEERLVGVNPGTQKTMQTHILGPYFPRFQHISSSICSEGFVPNIEEIIKLNPDLIFHWRMFQTDIDQMRDFGLNVVGLEYDGSEKNDRDIIMRIARAMNHEQKADSILAWREKVLHQIKNISKMIPENNRPKAIFLYNYENFTVGGEKCYENFCINLAGGRNLGAGLGIDRSVDIEQILEWNPDVIFFGGWRKEPSPLDIYHNPLLAEVNAIKNRHVFKMPVWTSTEIVLAWKWMAQLLHPEKFDFALREDIKSVYKWHYNIELADSEINNLLYYNENAHSPLYTQFK